MDIRSVWPAALEAAFPRECAACGRAVPPAQPWPVCPACAAALRPFGKPACELCGRELLAERGTCLRCRDRAYAFETAVSVHPYAGVARELLTAYKFGGRRELAPLFADMAAAALAASFPGRVVVPVPPRPGKLRRTGWDQVEAVARVLERRHGVRVDRLLVRRGKGQQKSLGSEARFENALRAFGLRPGAASPREPVLLDDVITTGATLSACAAALRAGGAVRVDVLALVAD